MNGLLEVWSCPGLGCWVLAWGLVFQHTANPQTNNIQDQPADQLWEWLYKSLPTAAILSFSIVVKWKKGGKRLLVRFIPLRLQDAPAINRPVTVWVVRNQPYVVPRFIRIHHWRHSGWDDHTVTPPFHDCRFLLHVYNRKPQVLKVWCGLSCWEPLNGLSLSGWGQQRNRKPHPLKARDPPKGLSFTRCGLWSFCAAHEVEGLWLVFLILWALQGRGHSRREEANENPPSCRQHSN